MFVKKMAAQNPTGLWVSLQNLNIYVSLETSFLEEKKKHTLSWKSNVPGKSSINKTFTAAIAMFTV